jgi:hypothetical protein
LVEVKVAVAPQVKQLESARRTTPLATLQVAHFPEVEFEVQV